MKAGYLQFHPLFGKPEVNISKIRDVLLNTEFDLVVLPELANSGYLFSNIDELNELSENIPGGVFCDTLKEICRKKNVFIVSGICEESEGNFYNSSVLVCPDGKIFLYRKIHLFDEEKKWFSPGNIPLEVYDIEGDFGNVKIGMMICFDWIFPETARTLALKGAQIICHPSNLVMQYCQRAMFIRALENHVFTITANKIGKDIKSDKELSFTGESIIINPFGDCLYKGSKSGEECIVVEFDPKEALKKNLNSNNHLFNDRREEFYKIVD